MRTGYYPGSFDPVTNGHVDVLQRACGVVDRLVLAVGVHHGKKPFLAPDVRVALLRAVAEPIGAARDTEIVVETFDTLVVDAARAAGATLLIRGLRDSTDFDYEMQMAGTNAELAPDLETVFLPASGSETVSLPVPVRMRNRNRVQAAGLRRMSDPRTRGSARRRPVPCERESRRAFRRIARSSLHRYPPSGAASSNCLAVREPRSCRIDETLHPRTRTR